VAEEKYHFAYDEASVYGCVMRLLRAHAPRGGVVVDLGAGYGAVAEPCRADGFDYVGFDLEAAGIEDLRARGFEGGVVNLERPAEVVEAIERVLAGRPLAAITLLDTLEHLTTGRETLAALSEYARGKGGATLVMSVPNVTHVDLATKLLLGRWDVTETGLLDRTHVAFFSPTAIVSVPAAAGWRQVGAEDFELEASDQRAPESLAVQSPTTPVGGLLRSVRAGAGPGAVVNQFVRAYVADEPVVAAAPRDDAPFATVLVRTQGRRPRTLHDALLSVAAQTCEDYELLLLCHDAPDDGMATVERLVEAMPPDFAARVRVVPVKGGRRGRPLNAGLAEARGRYVTVLDDDDVVMANWLAEFRRLAAVASGSILRAVVARQDFERADDGEAYEPVGAPTRPYPETFDMAEHLVDNWSPLCGFAFPRAGFAEFGVTFDEALDVLEDWDVVVALAPLCGVVSSTEATSVYRRWVVGSHSGIDHSEAEWEAARAVIRARMDGRTILLPPGGAATVRRMFDAYYQEAERANRLQELVVETQRRLDGVEDEFRASTSWRLTAPVRWVGDAVARRRGGGSGS
jgi:hypothetical protein